LASQIFKHYFSDQITLLLVLSMVESALHLMAVYWEDSNYSGTIKLHLHYLSRDILELEMVP